MTEEERKKQVKPEGPGAVFAPRGSALAKIDMMSVRLELEAIEQIKQEMKPHFEIFRQEAKKGLGRVNPTELKIMESHLRKIREKEREIQEKIHSIYPDIPLAVPNPKENEKHIQHILEMFRNGIQLSDSELDKMENSFNHWIETRFRLERKARQLFEKQEELLRLKDRQIELLEAHNRGLEAQRQINETILDTLQLKKEILEIQPGLAVLEERLKRPDIKAPSPELKKWRFVAA